MAFSPCGWLQCITLMLVFISSLHGGNPAPVDRSPASLAYSPDGRSLAVLDATSREVVQIDAVGNTILKRTRLDGTPSGLSWSPGSGSLFVSESGAGRISEISSTDGRLLRSFMCGRYPSGLALAPNRKLMLCADWGLNRLTVIDTASGTTRANIPVGSQPTAVAITRDETLAVVTALLPSGPANAPDHAAKITLVDLATLQVRSSLKLPLGSTAVRDVAISADGSHAYVTHVIGRFNLPCTQIDRGWVNTNAVSVINLRTGKIAGTVLLDQVMRGAADPWGIAIHPTQPLLYISLSGIHQLAVIRLDVLHELLKKEGATLLSDLAALQRVDGIQRIDLPAKGPRGVSVSPDGSKVAVAGYFSGNAVIVSPDGGSPVSIALGSAPDPTPERRGEIVFHDAGLCFQNWLSCATCHPDARADGLNWDQLNDGIGTPKNNRSLLWSDRTPPLMYLGVRSDMRAAIRAGFVHIEFTQPRDEDVENVMAYFRSLKPVISPHRKPDGSLTDSAVRGKRLFENTAVGCAACHPAPLFTHLESADVGTSLSFDQGATRFDTPSLIELWRNPPYLHHGRAADLHEVFTHFNPDDQHGTTSRLGKADLDDLIAYLLSL